MEGAQMYMFRCFFQSWLAFEVKPEEFDGLSNPFIIYFLLRFHDL
jgi:hypothetical protein